MKLEIIRRDPIEAAERAGYLAAIHGSHRQPNYPDSDRMLAWYAGHRKGLAEVQAECRRVLGRAA